MSAEALDLREGLKNARILCPGLSEIDYQVADTLSKTINSKLVPMGLVWSLALLFEGIEPEPENEHSEDRPSEENAMFFTQIIDTIANEEFANEFRDLCKKVFDWDTAQRINVAPGEYFKNEPHVIFATIWWMGVIQRQLTTFTLLDGSKVPKHNFVQFTPEMLKQFCNLLAGEISNEIWRNDDQKSYQRTDNWTPTTLGLTTATRSIHLETGNPFGVFPRKTRMEISEDSVTVDGEVLWQRDK